MFASKCNDLYSAFGRADRAIHHPGPGRPGGLVRDDHREANDRVEGRAGRLGDEAYRTIRGLAHV